MGRNEKQTQSLSKLWYIEQQLNIRGHGKLSREDNRILRDNRLELLIRPLRCALGIYLFFDVLFVVEDAVDNRELAHFIARFFITMICLVGTFISTFIPSFRRTHYFSFLTYFCVLVQSTSTSIYLYNASKSETPPVSPFLCMDIFFLFLFVRIHIVATFVCCILALILNYIIVISIGHPTALEIGNIIVYITCIILGFIAGYIFELNFRNKYFLGKEIAKDRASMASEREKSEKLLYNILPRSIADSLKNDLLGLGEKNRENDVIADNFEDTTIAFCDICDFTVISGEMQPEKLVNFLNDIFSAFDNLVHEYGLEKIKTIGDAYMFVGGLSKAPFIQTKHGSYTPAEAVAEMALSMQDAVDVVSKKLGFAVKVRVGLNSGSVVAGVVGISKFVYDLFGEAVNMSAKMESSGQPKRVHVSHATYLKLEDKYDFEPGQDVEVKDTFVKTFFLVGKKGQPRAPNVKASQLPSAHTLTDNLRQFLADGPSSPAGDFSPAKPKHTGAGGSRPVSPAPLDPPTLDGAQARPAAPYGDAVIYAGHPKTIDSDPYNSADYATVVAKAQGNSSEDAKVSRPPTYPTIFAKNGSQLSLDRHERTNEGVLRNKTSFASTHTHTSKLEDGFADIQPIDTPNLRLGELLRFDSRELEVRYRKDYFRKYFRLVQLNSLGSLALYITMGVLNLATLSETDYTSMLVFGAFALITATVVFVYFVGNDNRAYMHYLPAAQSAIASAGLILEAIVILKRDPLFEHHILLWDCCIVQIMFTFVFPGLPFLHAFTTTTPLLIALIAAVGAIDSDLAFQIVLRVLMIASIGVVVSYRKEVESRLQYFVTQAMDDERRKLVAERTKSEKLLYSILPQKIAQKLKQNDGSIADTFHDVTVMFVSIHNYTTLTQTLNHFESVSLLNKIFSKWDKLAEEKGVEKIKTIGPTYLVVGGLPVFKANHLASIAELALEMQEALSAFRAPNGERYKIKAGIHCGKVVAGVIGIYKFSYDLWGDTVNTASRMESHSLPGQIQVTEACHKKLASKFDFQDRGFIQVKGKGVMHTFFLMRQLKPKLLTSISAERLPNVMPERGNFSD